MAESVDVAQRLERLRGDQMRTPDEVAAMLRLKALGWGERRIASEVGCNRRTVRRYLAAEGWVGYRSPHRAKKLNGLEDWLAERFRRHCGNADVVRQDLEREHGIKVSLRTVERGVSHLRQELRAEARATVRFETPPGHQLQISILARCARPLLARACASTCLWRRWATHGGFSSKLSGTSGNRPGWTESRGRFATLVGHRGRCCSTTPARWSIATMRPLARSALTSGCTPSPVIGGSGQGPAPPTARAPRARTSAASATSSTTGLRARLYQLGRAGSALGLVAARDRQPAGSRHDGGTTDRALSAC
jgi:transposase